jgi:SNF2 family DNA or RNA helicase
VVTFASHSYEQYYQSIRRCWRFGQTNPVTVDVIASEGERYVRENMVRKAAAASAMFSELVKEMNNSVGIKKATYNEQLRTPSWL